MQVQGEGLGALLLCGTAGHHVLNHAVELRILVGLLDLDVEPVVDGVETRRLLHHGGNHVHV